MSLKIFDLDETLIAADSVTLFGRFLLSEGVVDEGFVEQESLYMDQYSAGKLDIHDFVDFFVGALRHLPVSDIQKMMPRFVESYIKPVVYHQGQARVKHYKEQGHDLLIISATPAFVVKEIAALLGIENVLAIDLVEEEVAGQSMYSGKILGTPTFREGKVTRLRSWLASNGASLKDSTFYSDSSNDIPLLELVDHPVVINPDERLLLKAQQDNWSVLHWKN